MSSQELVTLNVGGKIFTTRSSTLKQFPASRLTRMLDGRDQEFKMVGGQIFVDRDGVLFSFVLDFLRTHQLLLPTDFSDYLRLQREAVFYELDRSWWLSREVPTRQKPVYLSCSPSYACPGAWL